MNDWARYFDRCWEQLHPDLPLPYGDTSAETVLRAHQVRQYAEANASKWRLLRRNFERLLPW